MLSTSASDFPNWKQTEPSPLEEATAYRAEPAEPEPIGGSVETGRTNFRVKRKGSAQKGSCKNLFYEHRGRHGTFVEPKAIRGQFVDWWANRKTDCNETPGTFAELRGRYF